MDKQKLRARMKQKRDALSLSEIELFSAAICQKLELLPQFVEAKNVFIYKSFASEVSTDYIIKKYQALKNIYLPRINPDGCMDAVRVNHSTKYNANLYGISEPQGEAADKNILDLCVCPCLLLDKDGNRIGYGKGFYDKFLHNTQILTAALAYSFQLRKQLPYSCNDVKMKIIITETEIIYV